MIENLNTLVKENAQDTIINNPAIPNEKNEEVVKEASASIEDSLKKSLAGGNVSEVANLFNGTSETVTSSPVTQQATGSFIEKLQNRFGINFKEATSMANNLIPNVLKKLVNKTADPADKSFNIQDIFNQASGGKTIGMNVQAMMNKFKTGMDKDGDGDVDFQDIKAFFSNSGGVMDKVKGLFK